MIKRGDKVYYWRTINKIGTVVEILSESNNQLTVGGTTSTRIYYKVRYDDNTELVYLSGEILKHFD